MDNFLLTLWCASKSMDSSAASILIAVQSQAKPKLKDHHPRNTLIKKIRTSEQLLQIIVVIAANHSQYKAQDIIAELAWISIFARDATSKGSLYTSMGVSIRFSQDLQGSSKNSN